MKNFSLLIFFSFIFFVHVFANQRIRKIETIEKPEYTKYAKKIENIGYVIEGDIVLTEEQMEIYYQMKTEKG